MSFLVQSIVVFFTWFALFSSSSYAQSITLSPGRRLANGQVQMTISGTSANPVTLQASSDLKNWEDVQSFSLNGASIIYTDTQASTFRNRTYRVRADDAIALQLPDLGTLQN